MHFSTTQVKLKRTRESSTYGWCSSLKLEFILSLKRQEISMFMHFNTTKVKLMSEYASST